MCTSCEKILQSQDWAIFLSSLEKHAKEPCFDLHCIQELRDGIEKVSIPRTLVSFPWLSSFGLTLRKYDPNFSKILDLLHRKEKEHLPTSSKNIFFATLFNVQKPDKKTAKNLGLHLVMFKTYRCFVTRTSNLDRCGQSFCYSPTQQSTSLQCLRPIVVFEFAWRRCASNGDGEDRRAVCTKDVCITTQIRKTMAGKNAQKECLLSVLREDGEQAVVRPPNLPIHAPSNTPLPYENVFFARAPHGCEDSLCRAFLIRQLSFPPKAS